jgi:hypothetical protein
MSAGMGAGMVEKETIQFSKKEDVFINKKRWVQFLAFETNDLRQFLSSRNILYPIQLWWRLTLVVRRAIVIDKLFSKCSMCCITSDGS